eukprot:m.234811 g.234811  ORF g.234811 m.234811 type:complete len:183 (+) comp19779_c0_seq1:130-678(+)
MSCLTCGSASQIHPHTQASLGTKRYYGFGAHLMDVAAMYGAAHGGSSYFTHLIQVHEALGLALRYEDATVLTYLTPKKDWEMVVIAEKPSKAFFTLVHHTLRAYLDDMTLLSFSVAMFFPALNDAPSLPAIARIVERGVPASIRSDISAMELFAHSNVDVDPFVAARNMLPAIRRALARDPS